MTPSSPRNTIMVLLCVLIATGTPAYSQQAGAAEAAEEGDIAPIRVIWDRYPVYAGVAVDSVNDKAVMTDDNNFGVLLYDRDVPGSNDEASHQ